MTRCLDCGSERTADQCPSCGRTSAAAEVMFRHRLLKRTAVFLAGSLAFPYVSQIYPPLELDWILVFFGLIFFLALTLAMRCLWASSRGRSASHGISVCIAAEKCSLVRWLAVDENRDLQFQDVTIFAEAKSHQLHAADVARFPIGSLERLVGLIGR